MAKFRLPFNAVEETAMEARTGLGGGTCVAYFGADLHVLCTLPEVYKTCLEKVSGRVLKSTQKEELDALRGSAASTKPSWP